MKTAFYYIFILIAIFLVVAYYKGATANVSTAGGVLNTLIQTLQGRNNQTGAATNYPQ